MWQMGSAILPYWYMWLAAAVLGGMRWAFNRWREGHAQSWPVTKGTIEWTWVRQEGVRENQAVPEVCYSYSVNGEFFSGTYETGEENFELFPKGTPIMIHYNPEKPSVSFVDREDMRLRKSGAGRTV